ncbi:LysE family transporter [Chelativorans sp. ZYF759]|uniref:LysE/ArgO family amino acid transporter n=1 Tax=Chelativorans sp. ZYF759 TaxID=2692213 RepID=UPI00145D6277|nr:LysE/ArgO family amino acid transporter [Chelativorans sp. ZYF759]NMG41515.1 LysE family transporter [Chelativorans sp. ZYF759]
MSGLNLAPFFSGFGLGLSLIAAIGAQNAFILRQGLMRAHVFVLCAICALADAVLIVAGVAGLGSLVAQSPVLIVAVTVGGAAFLLGYAALAFRRALAPGTLQAARQGERDLGRAVLACLAFTFLNPHVYLDTVVLLGGLSAGFEGTARIAFGSGAVTASFVWFFTLGYGARLLAPFFARPSSWRVLDTAIGAIMVLIALGLLARLF